MTWNGGKAHIYTGKCGRKKVKGSPAAGGGGASGGHGDVSTFEIPSVASLSVSPEQRRYGDHPPEKRGLDGFQQLATLYSLLNRQGWRELSAVRESCPT